MKTQWDPPSSLVLLGLHIACEKEALLAKSDLAGFLSDCNDGETNLADPVVHETVDVLTRSLAQSRPQVIGSGIRVLVCLEVVGNTLQEDLLAKVSAQHADDGGALQVTDVVKDLINLEAVIDGHLDGMRKAKAVKCEGCLDRFGLD